jgi:NADH-quinone oxidoreductase subunit E
MDQETKDIRFPDATLKKIGQILSRYPDKRSAILPVLDLAQREFGWISEPVMVYVAELLELTPPKVFEVVTFYTMYNQKPVGKFHIQLCRTLSCALLGSEDLAGHLQRRFGMKIGETTPDGMFTLKLVECLGSCGSAPAVQINDAYYENLTKDKLDQLLNRLKEGESPIPRAMGEN